MNKLIAVTFLAAFVACTFACDSEQCETEICACLRERAGARSSMECSDVKNHHFNFRCNRNYLECMSLKGCVHQTKHL